MSLYDPNYIKSIVNYTDSGIPKIIHQIWINEDNRIMPKSWGISPVEWKKYHSVEDGYIYILWEKDTARDFISIYFPNYLESYDKLKYVVSRCDMLRIALMYKYGGIY